MNKIFKRIPVLLWVLVFVFMQVGCGQKEVLDLAELEAETGATAGAEITDEIGESSVAEADGSTGSDASKTELSGVQSAVQQDGSSAAPENAAGEIAQTCIVHVCGAVNNPGVYTLPAGSRIYDAVVMAGGLSQDASESSVNQAAPISDGMQILIPTVEEAEASGMNVSGTVGGNSASGQSAGVTAAGSASTDPADGLVDLNTATAAELMTLPGIGETRAQAILAYREQNGRFSSIEEIMQVNGIKEGSFEKLRDYITVR